mmetsp:Transcript_26601/g.64363  ORF Transcript_26601/g.64363 Transcript_26601/m.64363 type:complete len:233 (+) Transcript_26601:615-1313(+)
MMKRRRRRERRRRMRARRTRRRKSLRTRKKTRRRKRRKKKDKKKAKEDKDDRKDNFLLEERTTERVGVPKLIAQDGLGVCEKTIVKLGTGRRPLKGQECTLHCKGVMMKAKKEFWNTREKKGDGRKVKPYKFRVGVGKVIKGWDTGVLSMRLGEIAKIVVTGSYSYGLKGNVKWGIPPNCDLEFTMELLHIGDDVVLPDKYELMKQQVKNRHTFLARDPSSSYMLQFRNAPF